VDTLCALFATLSQLLAALPPAPIPEDDALLRALEAACPSGESFDGDAVALGAIHQELRDLTAMVKWAVVRGATRVRLWLE